MKNKIVFIACDTSNINQIKKIIKETKTDKLKIIPKFGLQFFYSKKGRKFLENFKKDFWLDLKINDIPQTALSAIDSLKDLKRCKYITVHTNGGSAQEAKIVRKKYKNLFIVTPGIRLPGDNTNDQSRVMTPNGAFKNKVSGIVMGRSLIKGNIRNNIQRLVDHLNQ